jgi:asparagine synthase (glutamine-hydrolysing)
MIRLYGGYGSRALIQSIKDFYHTHASEEIKLLLETDRVVVFGDTHAPAVGKDYSLVFPQEHGVLTGRIFDSATYKTILQVDTNTAFLFSESPHKILQAYWGTYSGILYNKRNNSCTLIRDPIGLSRLFYTKNEQGIVFANTIAQIYDILEEKPDLNFHYLARYIINIEQASPDTPFNQIYELLPGMGLTIYPDVSTEQNLLWEIDQCKGSYIPRPEETEQELLDTLKKSVGAWTRGETGVAVQLSGGTDSSGLMLILRNVLQNDQPLIGLNFIDSQAPSSNEVEYAQEIAQLCKSPLHFIDMDQGSIAADLPSNWRPCRPNTFLLFNHMDVQTKLLAQQHGCSTIMNGQGGDHVFLAPQPKRALCDAILDKRWRAIPDILHELSTVYRTSWTSLAKQAFVDIKKYYRGTLSPFETEQVEQGANISYITSQFIPKTPPSSYLEPYLQHFLPGKIAHIAALAHAVEYAERDILSGITMPHPLLSQPVVELGLKIPTYQTFANGYDRIYFRKAVTKLQKTKALWRNIKGETSSSMVKNLAKSTDYIHDLVTGGRLAKEGVINLEWVEKEIQKIKHGHVDNLWPLLHMIAVNKWLKQWGLY